MKRIPARVVWFAVGAFLALMLLVGWIYSQRSADQFIAPTTVETGKPAEPVAAIQPSLRETREQDPRYIDFDPLIFWWDAVPDNLRQVAIQTGPASNMHADDYVGPEACQKCHQKNHEQWSQHPHRWMNALAVPENVRGDFTGEQKISYLGGEASFYTDEDGFRMKLVRDGDELTYDVRQTIGSRFFQYYIGRLLPGRFAEEHPYRTTNHVLPFGYWLAQKQWVPVVHVGKERPDGLRDDPFAPPPKPRVGIDFTPYAANCNMCHTTFPLADNLTRKPGQLAKHAPMRLHWDMGSHFLKEHSELWGSSEHPWQVPSKGIDHFPEMLMSYEAEEHAVTLGISCEACHLGCKEHAKDPKVKPDFLPHSPLLLLQNESGQLQPGRTHQNVNWICARCHVGERPQFAAGMSTWNSVEYSDAMLGSCYSELKCIDCHPPHQATGHQWQRSPAEDDASCVRCHTKYESSTAIENHTHHAPGSSGSRCMNCHMPKLNEGLQAVVRTHTIFSPTNAAMIEANHPNACNLCHTDRPIDWTLQHLQDWYGASYPEEQIAKAYPDRQLAVAAGWMKSEAEAVRLVAAAAACRANDKSLLPELVDMLDDPFLLNRQFTLLGIEGLLETPLDEYGYRFYMTPAERAEPLRLLREAIQPDAP